MLPLALLLVATAAHADPQPAYAGLPDDPHLDAWVLGIDPVFEMVPGNTVGALGDVGLELDYGRRIDSLYVGATSELSYIFGQPTLDGDAFSTGVPSFRVRVGGELRYALAWSGAGVDCYGNYQLPSSLWVGVRAGVEAVDGTGGKFVDFSFGFNHFYFKGGFSVDPAGTYGQAILGGKIVGDKAGSVTPFMGLGIRALFD